MLQEGEDAPSGEIHRRESERGLLDGDLDDPDEEGLDDGLATPPLQHSPSWSLSRSRINSCRVMKIYSLISYTGMKDCLRTIDTISEQHVSSFFCDFFFF